MAALAFIPRPHSSSASQILQDELKGVEKTAAPPLAMLWVESSDAIGMNKWGPDALVRVRNEAAAEMDVYFSWRIQIFCSPVRSPLCNASTCTCPWTLRFTASRASGCASCRRRAPQHNARATHSGGQAHWRRRLCKLHGWRARHSDQTKMGIGKNWLLVGEDGVCWRRWSDGIQYTTRWQG